MKTFLPAAIVRCCATACFILISLCGFSQTQLQVTLESITESCRNDGSASLNVSGGTAPYTAYWLQYHQAPGGSGTDTVATGLSASGLASGYYMVHVYDSGTPAVMSYYSVWIRGAFNLSPRIFPDTCSRSLGKLRITVSGDSLSGPVTGPFSYEWSNGINNLNTGATTDSITGLLAGSYTVKVTDGDGCFVLGGGGEGSTSNPYGYNIWNASTIQSTSAATPSNCFDGTATVNPSNGTAPYTFLWGIQPAQFTQTATGLPPGFIQCLITDAEGCTRITYVNVPAGPNYLQANAAVAPENCVQQNGAITLNVTGGLAPYTYSWSNGATASSINGLSSGYYRVTIEDSQGCSLTIHKHVPRSSPVHVELSAMLPTCGNADGQVNASVTGGTAPYSYAWNNGVTSSTYPNAPEGYYYLTVTDANGCTGYDYLNLQESASCDVHIRGRVFNDLNGNCVQDPGETGLARVLVNAGPGYHYATTDNNGNYSISLDAGEYDIQVYVPQKWQQICPASPATLHVSALSPGTVYGGNHFYLAPDSVFNDLRVTVSSGPARPGFQVTWYVNVENKGTTALSPVLQFRHDTLNTYNGSNPAASAYDAASRLLTWNVSPLVPGASRTYHIYTRLAVASPFGDSTRAEASALVTGPDATPENNTYYYARLITGSYDPNDKAVTPEGLGEEGLIQMDDTSAFFYRIRFQNTGTDTAFTVVIRDTLDPSLDVPSFSLHSYSHPIEYEITKEGIITFTFNNILLPDSNINEPGSHGQVSYYIRRKPDLPVGTRIQNTASIYFDYNPPIHTNTTLNTLFDHTVGVKKQELLKAVLAPNPTGAVSMLSLQLESAAPVRLSIQDLAGRTLYIRNLGTLAAGEQQLPLSRHALGLPDGLYFIRIDAGPASVTRKWVVTK